MASGADLDELKLHPVVSPELIAEITERVTERVTKEGTHYMLLYAAPSLANSPHSGRTLVEANKHRWWNLEQVQLYFIPAANEYSAISNTVYEAGVSASSTHGASITTQQSSGQAERTVLRSSPCRIKNVLDGRAVYDRSEVGQAVW
jgi:hypothetical protein